MELMGLSPSLVEDETKVKGRVAWDHCNDTLVGFCNPTIEHVCLSNYREIVGTCDAEYNKIVDGFHNNHVGLFARIVMVNPLHESLPQFVLVVTCTCNCFDSL